MMNIRTQGTHFVADDKIVTIAGFNDLRLFQRFIANEDIQPILQNRQQLFAETSPSFPIKALRILSMGGPPAFPRFVPNVDYQYTSITAFTDFLYEFGFVVDWECLAGCAQLMPELSDQKKHWHKMIDALNAASVPKLLSLGNEWNVNGFRPENFNGLRAPFTCTKGSAAGGNYPDVSELWDYSKYHPRRDNLKGLMSIGRYMGYVVGGDNEGANGSEFFYGTHQATIVDEWLGAADEPIEGRRTNRPNDHYRAALDASTWGAGGYFHSQNGIDSVILSQRQYECGLAYLMGLSKCDPVQNFDGTYVN